MRAIESHEVLCTDLLDHLGGSDAPSQVPDYTPLAIPKLNELIRVRWLDSADVKHLASVNRSGGTDVYHPRIGAGCCGVFPP